MGGSWARWCVAAIGSIFAASRGVVLGDIGDHTTAIFRQINKEKVVAHHDALEFPDGQIVLLTSLSEGQQATVLQLPAEPKTVVGFEAQRRAAYVG